jgi:hypothetical protein
LRLHVRPGGDTLDQKILPQGATTFPQQPFTRTQLHLVREEIEGPVVPGKDGQGLGRIGSRIKVGGDPGTQFTRKRSPSCTSS